MKQLNIDQSRPGIFLGRIPHSASPVTEKKVKVNWFSYLSSSLNSILDLDITTPATSIISEEKNIEYLSESLRMEWKKWFEVVPSIAFHTQNIDLGSMYSINQMKKKVEGCHKNTNQKKEQLFKEHIILIEERIELSKKSNQELKKYKKNCAEEEKIQKIEKKKKGRKMFSVTQKDNEVISKKRKRNNDNFGSN